VSHLVETLKAIEYCFARKDQAVAEAHTLIVRGYCETIYGITYQVNNLLNTEALWLSATWLIVSRFFG